jgi:hypothetical protein
MGKGAGEVCEVRSVVAECQERAGGKIEEKVKQKK